MSVSGEIMQSSFPAAYQDEQESEDRQASSFELLQQYADAENIAEFLDEDRLNKIGQRCIEEYKIDDDSRDEWKRKNEDAIKLAKLTNEGKSWPWPGCANIKYPLLAEACISFAARAYPEIVRGNDVVLAKVTGEDKDGQKAARAKRISQHMSYQLTDQMEEWEPETDRLLLQLPLLGCTFRKTYYDTTRRRNVAKLVSSMDLVLNHYAGSMEMVRRESEVVELYQNDVIERKRAGLWLDVDLKPDNKEGIPDEDNAFRFIEQHRWLDLDDDEYEEPYIVTVHEDTGKVVRIVARYDFDDILFNSNDPFTAQVVRITPERYYTLYEFMPDPEGGLYGLGFGSLLTSLNESVNSILNQLIDAGTLANVSGGFIAKGVRLRTATGQIMMAPGKWSTVEVQNGTPIGHNILPNPNKEPSVVLFQLLGFLIESSKAISNLKDLLQGELPNSNVPATTVLALIEQGQKVYNAIHKRVYRALKSEFKKIYKLNAKYLPEQDYFRVMDSPQAIAKQDYAEGDYDICPVADPQVSSQAQRLARAQALMQIAGSIPGAKMDAIAEDYVLAIGVDNPERYLPTAEEMQKQAQQQQALQQVTQESALQQAAGQMAKTQAEIQKIQADALYSLARAESEEAGVQLEQYKQRLGVLTHDLQMRAEQHKQAMDVINAHIQQRRNNREVADGKPIEGRMGPVESEPRDPMVLGQIAGGNPGTQGLAGFGINASP